MILEQKLNKYERYKLRTSPYEFFPQLQTLDFENLGEADRYYLQDFGIFSTDFLEDEFTLRIRVPAGRLTAQQFQGIADIVTQQDLHIILTARAGMQIHGLSCENVLDVFNQINDLGLTSWQSFGDNVRNIVTDIYDGVGQYCEIETYHIILQMQEKILKNPRYVGMLPRRISVGISGNSANVVSLFANDLYFALAKKDRIFGFNVYMGGKNSEVAKDADIFLHVSEVVDFFGAFVEAFYIHGLRGSRMKTRLFHLLEAIGMEKFKEHIENDYGKPFEKSGELQLQKARFSQNEKLKNGAYAFCYQTDFARINAKEIHQIAQYAMENNTQIRFGIDQNIYLFGLQEEIKPFNAPKQSATIVACAGSEYCPYSFWNIKDETSYLPLDKISEHSIQVGFSGCAKGCGRHQHTDIGLIGLKTNNFGAAEGGARVFIGAEHISGNSVGRLLFSMVPLVHLNALLTLIIRLYEQGEYHYFEEYIHNILNQYSEKFLAMWLLLNLETSQEIGVPKNEKNSLHVKENFVEENFEYEKELLQDYFPESLSFNLIEDDFSNAISELSKKLWTVKGKNQKYEPPIKRIAFR